ncbi:MAG: AlpA family phage regulatory protein [Alphaproteobacteria bacterium]|nr:AlpA family phage regulatory protein [Alphaproteobacteria bacterium]
MDFPEVKRYIPLSKSRYYFLMKSGRVPQCVKISEHRACWLLSEVLSYANQQIQKRNVKGGEK